MLIRRGLLRTLVMGLVLQAGMMEAVQAQISPGASDGPTASPEAMLDDALKRIETGALEDAMDLLQRARILDPKLDKLLLVEGLLAIEHRSHVDAIDRLQRYNMTSEGRVDYRGYAAIGRAYMDSRMYRQAAPALRKAKDLAPLEQDGKSVRAEILSELAVAYDRLRRKADAIETAKEAERLSPDSPNVQLHLCQIALNAGDYETAEKAIGRAIALLETELETDALKEKNYYMLSSSYQLATRLQREKSLARPDDGLPFFSMAVIAREEAEIDRSIRLLKAREYVLQALTLQPGSRDWKVFVAGLEADLGAVDEAAKRLEEVLAEDPSNREALALRDRLSRRSGQPGTP